jgi:hypothetical protein
LMEGVKICMMTPMVQLNSTFFPLLLGLAWLLFFVPNRARPQRAVVRQVPHAQGWAQRKRSVD